VELLKVIVALYETGKLSTDLSEGQVLCRYSRELLANVLKAEHLAE
jgi:hypothetical protein